MSEPRPAPPAWRVVWWFGFVSLAADMVYEGARSVYGPLLAALGASAVVVGLVTGAGLFELKEIPHGDNSYGWAPTIVATVVSFLVGYAAIAWLLRYVSTNSYTPFVVYRVLLGGATLILLSAGVLTA